MQFSTMHAARSKPHPMGQAKRRPPKRQGISVGYVLKRFPVLSETFILNELLALEARGVRINIFSLEHPTEPRFHAGVSELTARITYVPQWKTDRRALWKHQLQAARRFGPRYFSALAYVLRSGRLKVLSQFLQASSIANQAFEGGLAHLHSHYANFVSDVTFFASWMTGIPYSFTAHAWDIYRSDVDHRALSRKVAKARFVVTVSDYNVVHLQQVANGAAQKIVRIYNGINLQRFSPNGRPPDDPFTLLTVSRLVEKKGIAIFIDACRQLRDRQVPFQAWIVGGGKLYAALKAQVRASQLQHQVKLLGPQAQQEILKRYHAAHLFVLPCIVGRDGNREGLPVSIVEALACGLPVVSTPITGIPEVVRHGHNGLLVPPGDASAVAQALETLIRDRQLYERLRRRARASVASRFDSRQTVRVLHGLFEGKSA